MGTIGTGWPAARQDGPQFLNLLIYADPLLLESCDGGRDYLWRKLLGHRNVSLFLTTLEAYTSMVDPISR